MNSPNGSSTTKTRTTVMVPSTAVAMPNARSDTQPTAAVTPQRARSAKINRYNSPRLARDQVVGPIVGPEHRA